MPYDLAPEAKAFIAAQEPCHVTKSALWHARNFETAEDQIALLQHAVALRKRNRALVWHCWEIAALRRRQGERRAAEREAKGARPAKSAAERRASYWRKRFKSDFPELLPYKLDRATRYPIISGELLPMSWKNIHELLTGRREKLESR
jgi:hypothetical protein